MTDKHEHRKLCKSCIWVTIFIMILTMSILMWTQGNVTSHIPEWHVVHHINHRITECLTSSKNGTYGEFLALFYTPNHACSSLGFGPLVRRDCDVVQGFNIDKSGFTTTDYLKPCPLRGESPCHRQTFVRDGHHVYQLPNSEAVHEFLMYCNAHSPKLISFKGTSKKILHYADQRFPVPNIVHYIWFSGGESFTFLYYLSFLGVHKFIKPDFIYLHGDNVPTGDWWNKTLTDVPNIYFVYKQRPMYIFGKKIKWIQHSADIARYEVIYDYGGIYLDTDVLVVKSFDPLRKFQLTLARESWKALSNGIIVGTRGEPFFRVWMETYRTFNPDEWGDHSVLMAGTLQKLFPALVHVEDGTLVSPNYKNRKQLFQNSYNWSKNYAVHVWKRHGYIPKGPQGIKTLNNTLGELMRYIYFGSKDLIS